MEMIDFGGGGIEDDGGVCESCEQVLKEGWCD